MLKAFSGAKVHRVITGAPKNFNAQTGLSTGDPEPVVRTEELIGCPIHSASHMKTVLWRHYQTPKDSTE